MAGAAGKDCTCRYSNRVYPKAARDKGKEFLSTFAYIFPAGASTIAAGTPPRAAGSRESGGRMETLNKGETIIKISADGKCTLEGKGVNGGIIIEALAALFTNAIAEICGVSEKVAAEMAGKALLHIAENSQEN